MVGVWRTSRETCGGNKGNGVRWPSAQLSTALKRQTCSWWHGPSWGPHQRITDVGAITTLALLFVGGFVVGTLCTEQALLKLILNGNHILSKRTFCISILYGECYEFSLFYMFYYVATNHLPFIFNTFSLSATNHIDTLYS